MLFSSSISGQIPSTSRIGLSQKAMSLRAISRRCSGTRGQSASAAPSSSSTPRSIITHSGDWKISRMRISLSSPLTPKRAIKAGGSKRMTTLPMSKTMFFIIYAFSVSFFPVSLRKNFRRRSRMARRSDRSREPTPYTRYRIRPETSMMNTVEAQRLPEALTL